MALRTTSWGNDLHSSSALTNAENISVEKSERPSLVEMTREQYETMLSRALRRPKNHTN